MQRISLVVIAISVALIAAIQLVGAVHDFGVHQRERSYKVQTGCAIDDGFAIGTADYLACIHYEAQGGTAQVGD